jgi:hypothetical protein
MNQISKEIFQKETSMCRKLALKNGNKCNWGECDKCGVIPLLHKLCDGKLLEDKTEVQDAKNKIIL